MIAISLHITIIPIITHLSTSTSTSTMLTGAYLEIWPEVAKLLPHNAWEICTDRLFISVTEITPWGLRERVISKFSSNEDLFQVSLCLCLRLKGLFLYNVDI